MEEVRKYGSDFDSEASKFNIILSELHHRIKTAEIQGMNQTQLKELVSAYVDTLKPKLDSWRKFEYNSISRYALKIPEENKYFFQSDGNSWIGDCDEYYLAAALILGDFKRKVDSSTYLECMLKVVENAFVDDEPAHREYMRTELLQNLNVLFGLDSHVINGYNKETDRYQNFIIIQDSARDEPLWYLVNPNAWWRFYGGGEDIIIPCVLPLNIDDIKLLLKTPQEFHVSCDGDLAHKMLMEEFEEFNIPITVIAHGTTNFSVEDLQATYGTKRKFGPQQPEFDFGF